MYKDRLRRMLEERQNQEGTKDEYFARDHDLTLATLRKWRSGGGLGDSILHNAGAVAKLFGHEVGFIVEELMNLTVEEAREWVLDIERVKNGLPPTNRIVTMQPPLKSKLEGAKALRKKRRPANVKKNTASELSPSK